MKKVAVAVVFFATSGCATFGIGGGHSACFNDLVAHGYLKESNERQGEGLCNQHSPEEVAMAKDLVDGGYDEFITVAASHVTGLTATQVECAKAEYDKTPKEPGKKFYVSNECKIAVAKPASSASAAVATHDVIDVAAANPDLSSFVQALKDNGLADILHQAGPYTLLAPNNAAFAALDDVRQKKFAEDKEWARGVLLKHIVKGPMDTQLARFKKKNPKLDVDTLGGRLFLGLEKPKMGAEYVRIDRAKLLSLDAPADNGVVDVIDTVLWQ